MKISNSLKFFCSILMSVLMTNAPAVAMADQAMLSTSTVVAEMDRAKAIEDVQNFLKQSDVQKALVQSGVSPEEASARMASLSQTELRQLSGQVQQARAGGDILIVILLVVLIIYFAKRI